MPKIKLNNALFALGLFTLSSAVGCAHSTPKELREARAAYREAAGGAASKDAPAQLHTADNALKLAEEAYIKDGDTEHTRDLSYVAMRKAQLAEVHARVLQNESRLAHLEANMSQAQAHELAKLRGEVHTQQEQLASAEAARTAAEAARTAAEAARKAAEARAAAANADLQRIASVKQETRGMVITLSGEVLFTSGKADLLPSAQAKLSEVANALTQQNPDATIVVEGHTDTQGSQAFNLDLSMRRAQAVRDYLAAHGVAADRITAQGLGFSRPLADNKTAEGRANNRRVEIVVQPQAAEGAAPKG
jgi:outer membrane protein OmpA-like peptidoglycan-associated protein